jgi:hypothetical protein
VEQNINFKMYKKCIYFLEKKVEKVDRFGSTFLKGGKGG